MKNKNIFIALGLGVVAYLLIKPKNTSNSAQTNFRDCGKRGGIFASRAKKQAYDACMQQNRALLSSQEPPPRNSLAFQQWLNVMLEAYGRAEWLFKPGGPFYKSKIFDEKALNEVLNQPVYDLPPSTPTTPNSPYPGQEDYGNWG